MISTNIFLGNYHVSGTVLEAGNLRAKPIDGLRPSWVSHTRSRERWETVLLPPWPTRPYLIWACYPSVFLLTHPTLVALASWLVFALGSHTLASGPLHCYSPPGTPLLTHPQIRGSLLPTLKSFLEVHSEPSPDHPVSNHTNIAVPPLPLIRPGFNFTSGPFHLLGCYIVP